MKKLHHLQKIAYSRFRGSIFYINTFNNLKIDRGQSIGTYIA